MKTPKGNKIVLMLMSDVLIYDALARLPASIKKHRQVNGDPKPPF
jgi:hypothetical protein